MFKFLPYHKSIFKTAQKQPQELFYKKRCFYRFLKVYRGTTLLKKETEFAEL